MAKATLYLLHYNNYYNRQVKKEDTLSSYLEYQLGYPITDINFIPNDFINTEQIVNWGYDDPDYLVVVDENENIDSRWFVVSTNRTRAGQLRLELHRDLIVDYYDNLIDEDTAIFVEKAMLSPDNNLIFNSENMSFNQIKTSETLLKDQSGCPWVVIYAAQSTNNDAGEAISTTFKGSINVETQVARTFTQSEFDNWSIKQNDGKGYVQSLRPTSSLMLAGVLNGVKDSAFYISNDYGVALGTTESWNIPANNIFTSQATVENISKLASDNNVWNKLRNIAEEKAINEQLLQDVKQYINQTIAVNTSSGTTEYYRVQATDPTTLGLPPIYILDVEGKVLTDVLQPAFDSCYENDMTANDAMIFFLMNYSAVKLVKLTKDLNTTLEYNITANRYHNLDAPYDLFCIPYSDELVITNTKVTNFTSITASKDIALNIARAIISKYSGSSNIYDAQILPYCPLINTKPSNGELDINVDGKGYTPITAGGTVGYILHATASSFQRTIDLETPITIQDYKVESECDMYRLCSPNYNGVFEFNAAKNGGVQYFNVSCTYKPFTPYIKVYPNFGRLYGDDNFNDARGLVCGGDFSLPMTSDAWATYELQNKNYQNSFDRQIQNMEVNNDVQREQQIWGIATGAAQGGVTGMMTGSIFGPAGMAVGAVAGAGLSIAGGIRDYQLSETLRNETLDYTKDQFGYQLGNIKALPQSLSKVSAYNIDNKYFPFLEYYTCSEIEKKALRDKIKYNGMTVMTIGNMKDYVDSYLGEDPMYFKGKLIRLEGIEEDYHVINAIADELYKGVFI